MCNLPAEPRNIKERIGRYDRAFAKELRQSGMISDGSGKRHLLASLYLLLNDVAGLRNKGA